MHGGKACERGGWSNAAGGRVRRRLEQAAAGATGNDAAAEAETRTGADTRRASTRDLESRFTLPTSTRRANDRHDERVAAALTRASRGQSEHARVAQVSSGASECEKCRVASENQSLEELTANVNEGIGSARR